MGKRKIRVLLFVPSLVAGGAERVVVTLLHNLSRENFDLSLALVSQQDSVFSRDLPDDVPLIDLQAPRLRYALLKIATVIRRLRPDVVLSTVDYFNVALAMTRPLWPRETKLVARPTILLSAALSRHRRPLLWRALQKMALHNTDLMIFQSPAMEEDYRQALRCRSGRGVVIPNPLDLDFVRKQAAQRGVDTGYDSRVFNLVAAGRLEEQKGFDIAIEALAFARNKEIHLTILGEGSQRHSLEDQLRKLRVENRVRLLGYRHNPYPFFAQADGFLLSSRFEGFPNVVLEAIACGTPVVATPVAGLSDVLGPIPECEISSDYTARALSDAIDRLAARGRRRVNRDAVRSFDVHEVVERYERTLAIAVRAERE